MRNTITRTFSVSLAVCKVYKNGTLSDCTITLPDSIGNTVAAEKYIRRNPSVISGKLVEVTKIDKETTLYGMDESDFLKYAKPYEQRGKETRNMITKTVKGFVGEYLYMTVDTHELCKRNVSVPADMSKKLDKYAKTIEQAGEKAITIENLKPIEALYGISESDFRKYGKKMLDHQHYSE